MPMAKNLVDTWYSVVGYNHCYEPTERGSNTAATIVSRVEVAEQSNIVRSIYPIRQMSRTLCFVKETKKMQFLTEPVRG